MGLCNSKSNSLSNKPQGNLIVDGFVRYAQGNHNGWVKQKASVPRFRDIHIEVLPTEQPLGTWRGHVFLDNTTLDEVIPYIRYKLGTDNFELLANQDDEWIFREVFDFSNPPSDLSFQPSGSSFIPKFSNVQQLMAGDHRGEMSERLEDTVIPDSDAMSSRNNATTPEEEDDEDDSDSDDDEGPDNGAPRPVSLAKTKQNSGAFEISSLPSTNNWLGISPTHNQRAKSTIGRMKGILDNEEVEKVPSPREIVFKRQEFSLESANKSIAMIAQSCKYALPKSKVSLPHLTRCTLRMMGCILEEIPERKKTRVKLSFMCSLDPELKEWENAVVKKTDLSKFGGKARVEAFLLRALEFFESPTQRLILNFRHLASASTGELQWKEVDRIKNELQPGTNVTHRKYGHGIVQGFDMKGRVRVVYDSKEVVDHLPEEKGELNVSVLIGTRVKHKDKGFGTVKQFDESGRVHVKFDNGDLHRYKQGAWKKKMHTVKLVGIGGALGTVKLSWRPYLTVREGMGRVRFAVGVSTEQVLEYILESNSQSSAAEKKSGSILERRVVEKINEHERVIYEHRKMPPPLTPRDFVFKEVWQEVAPKTYVVVFETQRRPDVLEKHQTVRGETYLSGWLLEPLYLEEESTDGEDHVCRVTYQLCLDTKGFVAPDAVDALRTSLLLAAVTDARAYFWEQSQSKIKSKFRISKRYSDMMSERPESASFASITDGIVNLPGATLGALSSATRITTNGLVSATLATTDGLVNATKVTGDAFASLLTPGLSTTNVAKGQKLAAAETIEVEE